MFSDATDDKFEPPRPPQPITAMFSLLLRFCPRRNAGAPRARPAAVAVCKNFRREARRVRDMVNLLTVQARLGNQIDSGKQGHRISLIRGCNCLTTKRADR